MRSDRGSADDSAGGATGGSSGAGGPRLASPSVFVLVLLLFLALPFLSVSCEVPDVGSIGADFRGAHLVSGAEPEVQIPPGLGDMGAQVPGSDQSDQPLPDPGVQPLAIIVALVLAAGVVLGLLPRLVSGVRRRMFGGAALASLAGVLMIVTQAVAQSNLTDRLAEDAKTLGEDTPGPEEISDKIVHTGVGFWLSLVLLFVIALGSVGYVYRDKLFPNQESSRRRAGSAPIWRAEPDDPD